MLACEDVPKPKTVRYVCTSEIDRDVNRKFTGLLARAGSWKVLKGTLMFLQFTDII